MPLQKTLYGANVIIFEGIMAFADKTLLEVRAGSSHVVLLTLACPVGLALNRLLQGGPRHSPCPRGACSPALPHPCGAVTGCWVRAGHQVEQTRQACRSHGGHDTFGRGGG